MVVSHYGDRDVCIRCAWIKGALVILVITLLAFAGAYVRSRSQTYGLRVVARLPSSVGGYRLLWAGGLVCDALIPISGSSASWEFLCLDDSGRVMKTVTNSASTVGFGLSIQCDRRIVLSEYDLEPMKCIASFDLNTAHLDPIESTKKAFWLTHIRYNYGRFWNHECTEFIASSWPDRHDENALVLIDKTRHSTKLWRLPRGRFRSWHWRDVDSHPWVLAVQPGALYQVGNNTPKQQVPALNDNVYAMLSPALDRAIGFANLGVGPFYVDFKRPGLRRRIRTTGGDDISSASVPWATWSPTGDRVAFLIEDSGGHARLYAGDPARPLRELNCPEGFLFPTYNGFAGSIQPDRTVVWSPDGETIYCLVITKNPSYYNGLECDVACARL